MSVSGEHHRGYWGLQMSVVSTTGELEIANVSGEHHRGYWRLQMSVVSTTGGAGDCKCQW